eukprot:3356617-Amphidinium_carterae.1
MRLMRNAPQDKNCKSDKNDSDDMKENHSNPLTPLDLGGLLWPDDLLRTFAPGCRTWKKLWCLLVVIPHVSPFNDCNFLRCAPFTGSPNMHLSHWADTDRKIGPRNVAPGTATTCRFGSC